MKKFYLILAAVFVISGARASEWRDSPAVTQLFRDAGVQGTFVLYDVGAGRYTGHDRKRAETRFLPASTFKIPNSLIGLTVGAVASVDEVLPYGGKPQRIKVWEQDMSLREAIRVSNVPVYQELARRIGLPRMREQLARLGYGNAQPGAVVDTFWLVGPLKISAVEQTRFLARLAQDQLPFPKAAMAKVRDITQVEQTPAYELHAKTGRTGEPHDLGWWVGWVHKGGRIYTFALNLDIVQEEDADKRIALARASLKALGLL
jgi:beta-lactamase class D OXA-50